jgi:hypothetical protein
LRNFANPPPGLKDILDLVNLAKNFYGKNKVVAYWGNKAFIKQTLLSSLNLFILFTSSY